jgi:hypothetical protein
MKRSPLDNPPKLEMRGGYRRNVETAASLDHKVVDKWNSIINKDSYKYWIPASKESRIGRW